MCKSETRRTQGVADPHNLPDLRIGLDPSLLDPPVELGLVCVAPPDDKGFRDGLLAEDALLLAQRGEAVTQRFDARDEVRRERLACETLRVERIDERAGGNRDVAVGRIGQAKNAPEWSIGRRTNVA